MFADINEYMTKTREERRLHLKLDEPCIEIGGSSLTCRGLLAHHLCTTIGKGMNIQLCHACNNKDCSNVNHLYWGASKDNVIDAMIAGTLTSISSRTDKKYGAEKAKEIRQKAGAAGGKAHRVSDEIRIDREKWKTAISETNVTKYGWVSILAKKMSCTHTHAQRIMKKYFAHIECYSRITSKRK